MNVWEAKDKIKKEERKRKTLNARLKKNRAKAANISLKLECAKREGRKLEDALLDSWERTTEAEQVLSKNGL